MSLIRYSASAPPTRPPIPGSQAQGLRAPGSSAGPFPLHDLEWLAEVDRAREDRNRIVHSFFRALAAAGIEQIDSEGRLSIWRGGQPGGGLLRLTLVQLREQLIAPGWVTAAEVEAVIDLCDDPGLIFMSQAIIAAWGRRPG